MNLRQALAAQGMSQSDLAESVGVGRSFVNDMVMNRRNPSVEVAKKILDAIHADKELRAQLVNQWHPQMAEWTGLLLPTHGATAQPYLDSLAKIDVEQPWGFAYVQVRDPAHATHVWAKSIGVCKLPCSYPRSMDLRWLRLNCHHEEGVKCHLCVGGGAKQ